MLSLIIFSLLIIGNINGDALFKASFQACPGSTGTIHYRPKTCSGNPTNTPPTLEDFIAIGAWTFNTAPKDPCPFGLSRGLLRFDQMTNTIPSHAVIQSAKLKLFGTGAMYSGHYAFSYFPNSPLQIYQSSGYYGPNRVQIFRVTSAYSMSTVTWNTQPSITTSSVLISESNVPFYYNAVVDVTTLVQDMVSSNKVYGFLLRLETEQYYRSMTFYSSNVADVSKRPVLEIEYKIPCNSKTASIDVDRVQADKL